jgi:hypothetical protein
MNIKYNIMLIWTRSDPIVFALNSKAITLNSRVITLNSLVITLNSIVITLNSIVLLELNWVGVGLSLVELGLSKQKKETLRFMSVYKFYNLMRYHLFYCVSRAEWFFEQKQRMIGDLIGLMTRLSNSFHILYGLHTIKRTL